MHEKLLKLDQHLNRMQGIMQDLSSMPAPLADLIKEQMKEGSLIQPLYPSRLMVLTPLSQHVVGST